MSLQLSYTVNHIHPFIFIFLCNILRYFFYRIKSIFFLGAIKFYFIFPRHVIAYVIKYQVVDLFPPYIKGRAS